MATPTSPRQRRGVHLGVALKPLGLKRPAKPRSRLVHTKTGAFVAVSSASKGEIPLCCPSFAQPRRHRDEGADLGAKNG